MYLCDSGNTNVFYLFILFIFIYIQRYQGLILHWLSYSYMKYACDYIIIYINAIILLYVYVYMYVCIL